MMEIGTDLGTEGIAEDGGEGQTLSEIHRRSVSNTPCQLLHHPLIIHPLQHHQIIMYDLNLLFLLSFSFNFHVICDS